jgi:hypothetical protein
MGRIGRDPRAPVETRGECVGLLTCPTKDRHRRHFAQSCHDGGRVVVLRISSPVLTHL